MRSKTAGKEHRENNKKRRIRATCTILNTKYRCSVRSFRYVKCVSSWRHTLCAKMVRMCAHRDALHLFPFYVFSFTHRWHLLSTSTATHTLLLNTSFRTLYFPIKRVILLYRLGLTI